MVHPKTRARVLAVVESLDYHPNRLARSLIHGRTGIVAVVVPDIHNPAFSDILAGVERAGQARGTLILVGSTGEDIAREAKLVEQFLAQRADGVILVAPRSPSRMLATWVRRAHGVVLINREAPGICDSVCVNQKQGAKDAVRYLMERGVRRVAYLAGPSHSYANRHRLEAVREVTQQHAILLDVWNVGQIPSADRAKRWAISPHVLDQVDAVLAYNDVMAMGVLQALADSGRRVPETIKVCGFDDLFWSAMTVPPLTTVRQPFDELGRQAYNLWEYRRDHPEKSRRRVRLPAELVVRGST